MRLKAAMGTVDCRPSLNSSSKTEFSSFMMPYEKIRLEGIVTKKPLSFSWLELRHRLQLIIVSKVILIFLDPAGFILTMSLNLLVKNLAALSGCQFPTFRLVSMFSAREPLWARYSRAGKIVAVKVCFYYRKKHLRHY